MRYSKIGAHSLRYGRAASDVLVASFRAGRDAPSPVLRQPGRERGALLVAFGGVLYSYNPDGMVPPNTKLSIPSKNGEAVLKAQPAEEEKPLSTPLPLCKVQELQSLLKAVEIPDYVIRTLQENSINGQDLLDMQHEDLLDPRFKIPPMLIRKVLKIPAAWTFFCSMTMSDTACSLTQREFLNYLRDSGLSQASLARLSKVYAASDVDGDGQLCFEEFVAASSWIIKVIGEELLLREQGSLEDGSVKTSCEIVHLETQLKESIAQFQGQISVGHSDTGAM